MQPYRLCNIYADSVVVKNRDFDQTQKDKYYYELTCVI